MNKSIFDERIDRTQSNCLKWNKYQGKDVVPLWVADSEFKSPQPVIDALQQRVREGVFGYHNPYHDTEANEAVVQWLQQQYQWTIDPDWIVWTPGVVPAFNVMLAAFCEPGDEIIIQVPNYPPILQAASLNQMQSLELTTKFNDASQRWEIDFEQLALFAARPTSKVFILCNPMNPCGTVYTQEELDTIAEICEKHNVLVCSDEIHADLVLDGSATHIPTGKVSKLKRQSVTLMAASKTFNVAGFGVSFAIIEDPQIRAKYKNKATGICPSANNLGVIAAKTAFNHCHDWYHAQLDYLRANQQYLATQINAIPGLKYVPSAATYLAWIDASGLGVEDVQKAFEDAGVGPSPGRDFGWPQFVRINFACPRAMLEDAIERLCVGLNR